MIQKPSEWFGNQFGTVIPKVWEGRCDRAVPFLVFLRIPHEPLFSNKDPLARCSVDVGPTIPTLLFNNFDFAGFEIKSSILILFLCKK